MVELTRRANLPVAPPPNLGTERFLELMAVDKKVMAGKIRLVLMQGLGCAVVTEEFAAEKLRETLDEYGRANA